MPRRFARHASLVALGGLLCATGLPSLARAATPRAVVADALAVPARDTIVATPISTSFDVVLRQSHPRALSALLGALSDPTSAQYRHFLTTAQFAQRFGATPRALDAVRTYLAGYGLRVGSLSRGRVVLRVRGTTPQIAAAFDAPVATVRTRDGRLRAQLTAPATMPVALAHLVAGVTGLSSVASTTPALAKTRRLTSATTPGTCPSAGSSAGPTPNALGGYTLQQQGQLYGLSTQWSRGNIGTGQTIGVYELAPYATADITTYFSCYALSPSVTNISVDGGSSDPNSEEATLDVEEASALAPGAAIEVYTGPNNSSGPTDVFTRIADDNTATVVTTSWGTCESDPSNDPAAEQPIFEQMAAQGQTVVAAAGDSGSSDCNGITNNNPAVDDPASQPFVTAVGGLSVSSISPLAQSVWNDGINTGGGAGGGGASALWSRPSWQNAPGITSSQTMRLVPDLSVMGDPSTGFIEFYTGSDTGVCSQNCYSSWTSIGGTSIGSPLVSAMTAVAAQACGVARLGFLNPALYAMARANTGFIDVTTGNNDLYGVGVFSAGPGFDEASGLGSPDPASFFTGLCPATFSTTASSLTAAVARPALSAADAVTLVARDGAGNPLINTVIHVSASAASGTIVLDGDPTTSAGAGAGAAGEDVTTDVSGGAVVSVTTTSPGPVTVTATYAGASVATTITFAGATATVPGRASIASLTARVGGFRLVVSPPSSAGGSRLTGYQYSINAGRTWVPLPGASRAVTVTRLARGRRYRVIVRALNAQGAGPSSGAATVTTRK